MGLHRSTLVEQLVENLACGILRSEWAPGDALPSLRTLAAEQGVTVPTAQRAIAQLEGLGMVEARHGSGVVVLDPRHYARLSLLPYWITALVDTPERARQVLADFLEVRRELAAGFVLKLPPQLDLGPLRETIGVFRAAVEEGSDLVALVAADLGVMRSLLALRPQLGIAAIFGTLERALMAVPALQQAMFATPEINLAGYETLLVLLSDDAFQIDRETIDAMLLAIDTDTLNRFADALARTP